MVDGVRNAQVVCCFMTPEYQESRNCRLELEYAHDKKKRIIPCMLGDKNDTEWRPFGWLQSITTGLNFVDIRDDSESNICLQVEELIGRIRNQLSFQPRESSCTSNDLFELIRHEYLQNSYIQRIIDEEKCFPIEQSYINLAIVESGEQRQSEKKFSQTAKKDAIIDTFKDIYGIKTVVDVKDIFKKCQNRMKKVLVLGRAGIGKSTFCRYVAYRWAKGEIWTQYQLLILLRLRSLTSSRYPPGHNYSPIDLVEKEYFCCDIILTEDKQRFKELCCSGQVLWLLDGYDEFVQNIPQQLQDVFDLILKTHHHILTSRPYLIALSYHVEMEITGFTNDNIAKYIEQFFEQIKDQLEYAATEGEKLINFLKSNPTIWDVAHIPVNLELICSLWADIDHPKARILTMTELYSNMTEWLCKRYLAKQKNLPRTEVAVMSKQDIYECCKTELIFLGNLAFKAMESNALIFQSSALEEALKNVRVTPHDKQYIFNIGVLKPVNTKPTDNQDCTKREYYFVHLSFQEHFAARYLVNALHGSSRQEAIEFIRRNKYNQRFALVFTFASGLLTAKEFFAQRRTFWDTLLGEPLDLVGFRHIQLIISCTEEVTDNSDIPHHSELINCVNKWIQYAVSQKCEAICKQLFNSLQRSTYLAEKQIIINPLINLFNSTNSQIRSKVCILIVALSTYNPQSDILLLLATALEDEDDDVRISACYAFGEMGEKAPTNEVISQLVSALDDVSYKDVRKSACEALGKIGKKAATNEVIRELVTALDDENKDVRRSAREALAQMGEKAAINEVINKLVNALGGESEYGRRSACYALSEMGENAATNEVISKLVNALDDEDADVRHSARYAVAQMGEKAATNEVISKLVSALDDENKYVTEHACESLGRMGGKVATNEVISKLICALGDNSEDVRRCACEALGKMGEKAATNEVISKLVIALDDEDEDVRYSACESLRKMDEKAATNDVISRLVSALDDESKYVRKSACEYLAQIGEKAVINEVISKLVSALDDRNEDARYSACESLGKMGDRAATNEVISKIAIALGDKNKKVRRSACYALAQMGEKAATNDGISNLLQTLNDNDYEIREAARHALEKTLVSYAVMAKLNSGTVEKLLSSIDGNLLKDVTFIPVGVLIKVYIDTRSNLWLSVATLVAFLQGRALTIIESTIVVYGSNGTVEIHESNQQLCDQLVDAFMQHAVRFDLPCMPPKTFPVLVGHSEEVVSRLPETSNDNVKRKIRSSACNLL